MSECKSAPLPTSVRQLAEQLPVERGNKGLRFERFFSGYDTEFTKTDTGSKRAALQKCVGGCGDTKALEQASARCQQLTKALGGQARVYSTDWHLVTGTGNNNPVENGFTWHPTLGTPYLPGSTIKGLVRAWAEQFLGWDKVEIQRWFGISEGGDGQVKEQAGEVIFMDAFPIEPPMLKVDIMTPHMGKWYEKGSEKQDKNTIPGDWHAPVPVPFLVTNSAKFLFALAPRPGCTVDMDSVFDALTDALAWLGIGSKTSAGYGHLSPDEAQTQMLQRSSMNEGERLLAQLEEQFRREQQFGPNKGSEASKMLQALEQNTEVTDWSHDVKSRLLQLAGEILKFHDPKAWNKLTKKKKPSLYMRLESLLAT
ncbi:type III-B CRISPR module RAMP protein Cmr6 [Marinobacterium stanieri]|uniref:type III-B CRISPR module RAMP protein Cmr6 n=1 Tax=Marinobacterium stanieri TaxID=49186 RepID=UPI003A913B62